LPVDMLSSWRWTRMSITGRGERAGEGESDMGQRAD
jgi:hypothetical protein